MNLKSTFLHVDINSFFATMSQQKNPRLRGQPVGIIKDAGRTCIIAASIEAKALGVKTGSTVKEARLVAPDIILIPAEFDLCLDATKKLKKLFESVTPSVQIFSLDEAFLDITHCLTHLHPNPCRLALSLKHQIKASLGEWVTCNIGISHNRFLAKLGSELAPKDSITVIGDHNKNLYLSTTDFSSVCGIGVRLEKRLHALGINSLYSLNFVSNSFLEQHFGPFWSKQLRLMSRGQDPHLFNFIDHLDYAKSVGRSITGFHLTKGESQIKAVLYNLTEEVTYKARRQGLAGRRVHLALYGPHHTTSLHTHITLDHYISHTPEMFHYLYHRLYKRSPHHFPIIKFAVRLSLLKPLTQIPLSLLPETQKQARLSAALDKISHKYGLFTVRSGLLKTDQIIYPEVTGFFGDKAYYLN